MRRKTVFVLLALLSLTPTRAQAEPDYSPFIRTLASIPLSLQFGSRNLFAPDVGGRFGVSIYPLPLILEGDFNLDLTANVSYTQGDRPLLFYVGAGPRFSQVGSSFLLGGGEPGSYLGLGGAAGLELGFESLGVIVEAGADVTFGLTGGSSPARFSPRLRVGLNLPIDTLGASF